MAKTSRRLLAKTVVRLLRERPTQRAATVRSLAAYLVKTKQAKLLDSVIKDIARELQRREGMLLAEVQTAFNLNAANRSRLEGYLRSATGAKHIELAETLNPQLLSGMIVRTADSELDTTARRTLRRFASLNSGGIE